MATFELRIPGDEKKYRVTGPEGSTPKDAMKKLRQQKIKERPEESGLQDFGEGIGLSALETYYGIKDLVSETDEEDKATLEDWRQDAGQSGWGTGGQVVGEIGQMLIPGGVVTKGLRGLSKAKKGVDAMRTARNLTRAAGDVTAATSLGALKAPDLGETRGGNALSEGVGAVVGEAGGALLGKAIRGINKTDAAKRMLDEGVNLTPGQAAESKFVQGAEAVAEVTPLVAHGVKRAQGSATENMADIALKKAAAPGKTVTEAGTKGVAQLRQGYKQAYKDAWAGATSLSYDGRIKFIETAVRYGPKMTKKQRRAVSSIMGDFKSLSKDVDPTKFQALDNELRKLMPTFMDDVNFQEVLKNMRQALREGAPDAVSTKLKDIDSTYGTYKVVERASKNAAEKAGEFDAMGLIGAVKAIGKDSAGYGGAPLQQYGTDAAQTVGRKMGGQPLEWFRRVAGITPTPLPMQLGGKVALGQTGAQKMATKASDAIPEYLKRPGLAGAATDQEQEDWWKWW